MERGGGDESATSWLAQSYKSTTSTPLRYPWYTATVVYNAWQFARLPSSCQQVAHLLPSMHSSRLSAMNQYSLKSLLSNRPTTTLSPLSIQNSATQQPYIQAVRTLSHCGVVLFGSSVLAMRIHGCRHNIGVQHSLTQRSSL